MRKLILGFFLLASLLGGSLIFPALVKAEVLFRGGEIVTARNVTNGQTNWVTSVEAKSQDEIEFRTFVENIGDTESSDVNFRVGFALDSGSTLKNRIFLGVWSAPQASGTVEVKVLGDIPQKLVYMPGKSVRYSSDCNGCTLSDNISKASGAYVGKVKPGEKTEVRFWAKLTDLQAGTTSTVTITPTPTKTQGQASTSGNIGGAAVAATSPKTGFMDPVWVRTLMWLGVGIAGAGLRQAAKKLGTIGL